MRVVRSHRPVDDQALSAAQVAGYLGKYSTKTASDDVATTTAHHRRLQATIADLDFRAQVAALGAAVTPYQLLGHWGRMLGFRGHFATKSRLEGWLAGPQQLGTAFRGVRDGSDFEWVKTHTFRKTVATLLDGSGASARMIADQLGHSRVSMTQDVYLGRRVGNAGNLAAQESYGPSPTASKTETREAFVPAFVPCDSVRTRG